MKTLFKIVIVTHFFLYSIEIKSQPNLIPNPSFEEYIYCPLGIGQINRAIPWVNPTVTSPDYFHHCNDSEGNGVLGVPYNLHGFQNANTGLGYAGIITYIGGNTREYIQVQLTDSLHSGLKYLVKFYVSLSDSCWYSNNSLGAYFSDSAIGSSLSTQLPYIPQIQNNSSNPLSSKDGWTLVCDSLIATGGERYITIGNFNDNSASDTNFVSNGGTATPQYLCYYYIDDVSVIESTDEVQEVSAEDFVEIFPNPTLGLINFKFINPIIKEIKITVINSMGQTIIPEHPLENKKLDLSTHPPGIYLLKLKINKELLVYKKIIIPH